MGGAAVCAVAMLAGMVALGGRMAGAQTPAVATPREPAMPRCTRWEMRLSEDLSGAVLPTQSEMEPIGVVHDPRTRAVRALLRRCVSRL